MRPPRLQQARLKAAHLPAPIGGINSVDPASAMPPSDAVLQENLVAGELGLRPRRGYREAAFIMEALSAATVRSLLPYSGAPGQSLVFYTASHLMMALDPAVYPSPSIYGLTFPSSTDDSGHGIAAPFSTAAGRHLLYCDEEHGYYTYTPEWPNPGWRKIVQPAATPWAASTAYVVGQAVVSTNGETYVCAWPGTSGEAAPSGTLSFGVDGSARWSHCTPITGGDPTTFAFVTTWKNRVWFAEKDSARAWYLPVGALYGEARSIDFGSRFPHGGTLVGLWSWTIDGGAGADDHLVAISSTGDVLVYQGTDPDSASSFAQIGAWYLGGVPAGRRIALAYGGDLLVLSRFGVVPLSALLRGGEVTDPTIYATAKIRPLFMSLVEERGDLSGWHLAISPADGTLLVTVPGVGDAEPEQFAFSLSRKAWSRYTGMDMVCAAELDGRLYFGARDGYVYCVCGYVDGTAAQRPIRWSMLQAFQNLGSPRLKRVHTIRPRILGTATVSATARYDYDDAAVTGGTLEAPRTFGANGQGSAMAIALRGESAEDVTIVGCDITWDEGGIG